EGKPALFTRDFLRFCVLDLYLLCISPRRCSSYCMPAMAACLAFSENSRWNTERRSSLLYCRIWSFMSFSIAGRKIEGNKFLFQIDLQRRAFGPLGGKLRG